MKTINETLSWLNQFDDSHLSNINRSLSRQIQTKKMEKSRLEAIIRGVILQSRSSADSLEYPEALLIAASVLFEYEDFQNANRYALVAIRQYASDEHRQAIARWMSGQTYWKIPNNNLAFAYWFQARELFNKLAQESARSGENEKAGWYRQRLLEMNVELVCTAEELYSWLDIFEPSKLSQPAVQLIESIAKNLEKSQYKKVYGLIDSLEIISKKSSDYLEVAEILIESSLALYKMGNLRDAVTFAQKAIDAFPPFGHHQAISRWILGVYQWQMPTEISKAVSNWQKALDIFEELAVKADYKNQQSRKEWYEKQEEYMALAMNQMIEENLA